MNLAMLRMLVPSVELGRLILMYSFGHTAQ